jgi:hypothetical protein
MGNRIVQFRRRMSTSGEACPSGRQPLRQRVSVLYLRREP